MNVTPQANQTVNYLVNTSPLKDDFMQKSSCLISRLFETTNSILTNFSVAQWCLNLMLNVFAMKLVIKECDRFQILLPNGLLH